MVFVNPLVLNARLGTYCILISDTAALSHVFIAHRGSITSAVINCH
jgi:hypothetical protein